MNICSILAGEKIISVLNSRSLLLITYLLLNACSNTSDDKQRATLADFAKEQTLDDFGNDVENDSDTTDLTLNMSKEERSAKLASLYQNILSIEPNREVRTKIAYRLAQIDTQAYEIQDDALQQAEKSDKSLTTLVKSYQRLLTLYPDRVENEEVHYQLAKALALQGKPNESLKQIELILVKYPDSQYSAELHFRRGDIYYNLQYYTKALKEYQAVISSKNADNYYVNSVYMSGWSQFKLSRLSESNKTFLTLLDYIITQETEQPFESDFSFSALDKRYVDLVSDIQRVLSISLSQQNQAESLVKLVKYHDANQPNNYLYLYGHLLFKNLAKFLFEKGLKHDAELTYQSYLEIAPDSIWAARYTLLLIELYSEQGKNKAIKPLQIKYVKQFGLSSQFWQKNLITSPTSFPNKGILIAEILPNLLTFSYQHSRYLYAQAQAQTVAKLRVKAFVNTAYWLKTYLSLAKLPEASLLINEFTSSKGLLADELLYADANFEAEQYKQALISYEYIAYKAPLSDEFLNSSDSLESLNSLSDLEKIKQEAAYATTLTIRELLASHIKAVQNKESISSDVIESIKAENLKTQQYLIADRNRLDKAFIAHYPNDDRALNLAVQQAQYAFTIDDFKVMEYYCNFILNTYGVIATTDVPTNISNKTSVEPIKVNHKSVSAKLSQKEIKQVQIASQLLANNLYQQGQYTQAEEGYSLALQYVENNSNIWAKMRELLSASIYFQAQNIALTQPMLAVQHYLRLGKQIPESSYRLNAHFDAANLLFTEQQWLEAIDELVVFQQRYPKHEYSRSIPAKLAKAYENIEEWEMAAAQYLAMVVLADSPSSSESGKDSLALKREATYSAAELYLKADNLDKAISTFRLYAHTYPKPFNIAQEVRFKMSNFYQQTKEPNKENYWYRKIIHYYDQQFTLKTLSPSSRDVYLASVAALALGQAHQQTFKHIKLKLPLNKSLAKKQKAMTLAINYYKKLLSFNLAEFVPHATYNLGQMYYQLSQDVMSSQRPQNLDELALEEYGFLLEEIVYPFEEKAIEIHTNNAQRAWQNIYDQWIEKSFSALAELDPALFNRKYDISSKAKKNKLENKNGGAINAVYTLH